MLKRATLLSDFFSAFPQAPLKDEEFEEFYVDVDRERDGHLSRVDELREKLRKENNKILFAGHRGSGKSTELNRMIRQIESTYFVARFSVTRELDVIDLNYIDLVMVFMEQIAAQAEEAGLIEKSNKYIEKITNWLSEVTEIKARDTGYMVEVGAGLKTDRGILSLMVGLIAEFKAAIKSSTSLKKEFRRKIEERINILKGYCNVLINEIHFQLKKQGKQLLVVIEDMDKGEINTIHDIFFKHSGVITELNTRVIFTVHIAHLTTPSVADIRGRYNIVRLPMLKVKNQDRSLYNPGLDIINRIVEKRADVALFQERVLERMIERSGGVLRDLFEMIEVAASSALFQKKYVIDQESSDYSFERLKMEYRAMITVWGEKGANLYNKLFEVKKSDAKEFPLDDTMFLLLSCLAVIEYNGKQWFDVHPAVESILDSIDMGKGK